MSCCKVLMYRSPTPTARPAGRAPRFPAMDMGCHTVSQGGRAAITPQFSANSHHIQGATLTDSLCYQCHWEANGDGSINIATHGGSAAPGSTIELVVYGTGTRPASYIAGTTAVSYKADGSRSEIQKISTHCLGCHSDRNDTTQPFGDGKTPKQYAWDGTSVDKRYSQTGTTPWGKYSSTTYPNVDSKNTLTKAFSAHGNASGNQTGWSLTSSYFGVSFAWEDKSAAVNVGCFDCHNSHGSAVGGATTNYASATPRGGILKSTTANKGGYTVSYEPKSGGTTTDKNAYNPGAALCFDCHLTGTSGPTPWGYSDTFLSAQSVMGYWDTAYFGPGTSASQERYPFKKQSTSSSGHFGASSALSTSPSGAINGLCTPCHDPHGVSTTLGANQQYGVPLLKGTWMASPYKDDAPPRSTSETRNNDVSVYIGSTPVYAIDQNTFCSSATRSWDWNCPTRITESPTQFGGLCLQCHPQSSISPDTNNTWKSMDRIHNTVKDWGGYGGNAANAVHSYTCSKCHAPHNSRLPRLMVTNCLDSSHRGWLATGGTAGNYSLSGSGSRGHGSGGGGFPGGGTGVGYSHASTTPNVSIDYFFGNTVGCHSSTNSASWPSNQLWNEKTTWVIPTTPTVITTANASCGPSCSVTLKWNASSISNGNPIEYLVQVDTVNTFNSPGIVTSDWISGISWPVTLNTNTRYYWRVKARDKNKPSYVSSWSTAYCGLYCDPTPNFFLSDGSAPPQVTLSSPAEGSVIAASCSYYNCTGWGCGYYCTYPLALAWNDVPPLVQYSAEISTAPAFTPISSTSSWSTSTSWRPGVTAGGTYYWRVQARDTVSLATGSWSSPSSYAIIAPPSIPGLITMQSTTCVDSACPITLQWNPSINNNGDPLEYNVWVDTVSTFNSGNLKQSEWISETNWTVSLNSNTKYYWEARARNKLYASAFSAFSTAGNFYLSDGIAPPQVTLVQPLNGNTGYCSCWSDLSYLSWNAAPAFSDYQVQVSTDPGFSTFFGQSGWINNSSWDLFCSTGVDGTPGAAYYWRVQARDSLSLEAGPWSHVRSFTCY